MKILYVVPYVPNLIRVRPYNLIRSLAEKGHQVTLLTLATNLTDLEDADRLRDQGPEVIVFPLERWRTLLNCLAVLPTREPLQAAYSWHPRLAQSLQQLALQSGDARFDLIHVEHLRGARYGLLFNQHRQLDSPHTLPVIWDSVDSISLLFRQAASQSQKRISRWMSRLELSRTEYYESRLPQQFDKVLVTSRADRQEFLDLAQSNGLKPPPEIDVLPNGVDLDYFSPDDHQSREPATLVISGKMSYHANVSMVMHFVKEVMPKVWKEKPETRLWVVGKDPPGEIKELANNPLVEVTGTVKDIRPYLRRATLAVAPLTYGVGIQNKVLEAMACATPVIAASQAVSALQAVPDRDVWIASGPAEMAQKILLLIDHPETQAEIGRAGRRYVEIHHRWEVIVDQLVEVYDEVIQFKRSTLQKAYL